MPESQLRRLTAILATDIAGYSRLVENDDEGTLARWKAHCHELIEPNIKEFHGRIVRVIGDAAIVEFASVVDAVRCAVEIQRGMAARNADVPQDKRIVLRMGINFGELILDGGDVWGDAVNIAARLEALAEPGGICVSGRVQEDARGKLDIVFEDAGEQQLKNIARPVRIYRIRIGSGVSSPPVIPRKPGAARSRLRVGLVAVALLFLLGGGVWQLVSHPFSLSQVFREVQAPALLPDKRSVAVLPFLNMSSDPEQEYFSDGMTEDLITDLSRLTGLFVIARNSVAEPNSDRTIAHRARENVAALRDLDEAYDRCGSFSTEPASPADHSMSALARKRPCFGADAKGREGPIAVNLKTGCSSHRFSRLGVSGVA